MNTRGRYEEAISVFFFFSLMKLGMGDTGCMGKHRNSGATRPQREGER